MSGFEKWQVVNLTVANVLLLGAALGAWYFGFKQSEIAHEQVEINRRLFDLEYEVATDVEYDKDKKAFVLWNKSRHSIYFGGARFGGSGPLLPTPKQIPIGGKEQVRRHQDYDEAAPSDGGLDEIVTFYLMDERKEKYVLSVEVSARNRGGKLDTIELRKNAPLKANW